MVPIGLLTDWLERRFIVTHCTANRKLVSSRRMLDIEWTRLTGQLNCIWTSWTLWQVLWTHGCQARVGVVTARTEVSCAETEKHCRRATVAALEQHELCAVLPTRHCIRHS